MFRLARLTALTAAAWLSLAALPAADASTIANGGFEAGFTSWVRVDQVGSDGSFLLQSGLASPLNGDPVPAPPAGTTAAMSDGFGPGAHVLYQDFLATAGAQTLKFDLFVGNRADRFATPASLDFALTSPIGAQTLNQQVRVDLLRAAADPFSVAASDVLQSLYASQVGDPLVSGYRSFAFDLSGVLSAHGGELLRLRFAETDNLAQLQLGIDNVDIAVNSIPEPASHALLLVGLAALLARRHHAGRGGRRP
ncbi:PEP-CTERM sorting domain-containing protein [Roseateles violae]|uniref:PEP-CTERM sorting domain-containing protein n=1 Tax=Roseateles violae TaxID=3058042 RepID=A0ABT8DPS6_9BURK|nr:PEP-CTERM sorting domain-containing protein [Pelomonas sp. PFR6]MDN3920345.1 PEP-CTERM sorting domain-containing protein [Pelomonas sp. PFR6]